MNNILTNAIASITLGIEDYKSEGRHRPLSALRNISAGILLLFKAKLAQLAPDETLIKKDFKLVWQDGQASWAAKGDKTIDYQGIQERFRLVDIRFDFKEMDRIIGQRNRIEHYVADVPVEAIRDSIANAVNLINRFCREQMKVEAASLFDPDTWQMVLKEKVIHDVEKATCNARMAQIVWPHSELLTIAVNHYLCGTCESDLVSPVDPNVRLVEIRFSCAACGAVEGYMSAMEAAFLSWVWEDNLLSTEHSGNLSDNCDKCMSDLVLAANGYCIACEYENYKGCDGCGQIFRRNHFCEHCDCSDVQIAS